MSGDGGLQEVTVFMAVHNRASVTARCLEHLDIAGNAARCEIRRVIVDDGSTDDTWQVLQGAARPSDIFLHGDGSLFWAGGMAKAMQAVDANALRGHILLLNDDAVLHEDALKVLIKRARADELHIVVGTFLDPVTHEPTYGGYLRRSRIRPLTFDPMIEGRGLSADSMNANAVLMGSEAFRRTGGIDPAFRHSLGDFDLALRARRMGLSILVTETPVGICGRNSTLGTWQDSTLPRRVRLKLMLSPKGLPPRQWARFCWRHGGIAGVPYVLAPWVRLAVRR